MKLHLSAIALSLTLLTSACGPQTHPPKVTTPPPAKTVTEADLASIVLTTDAERRLGVSTMPIAVKRVARGRVLAGELLLPLGRTTNSSSAGSASAKSIYSLLPAMTPAELIRVGEMQVEADGAITAAQVELEAAKVAMERAQNLVSNSAGTQRAVDDARARVQMGEAALQTAGKRRALLGAQLFEAVRLDILWVRVAAYAGDLGQINRDAAATVSNFGATNLEASHLAKPVAVPFSSSAVPATVELFYELDNADGKLRPGEKVSVTVPLNGETEGSVVPASAVLYDIHGGTWVYENASPQKYTRRRIDVRYISGGMAVLARGPAPGTKIVMAGAAELFGVEFGFGK